MLFNFHIRSLLLDSLIGNKLKDIFKGSIYLVLKSICRAGGKF